VRGAARDERGVGRLLALGALRRIAFVVVRRRFFMASLPADVPTAAKLLPQHREYRNTPAASCSPQGQEMASYWLRPLPWKGLRQALCDWSLTSDFDRNGDLPVEHQAQIIWPTILHALTITAWSQIDRTEREDNAYRLSAARFAHRCIGQAKRLVLHFSLVESQQA
jgi:hypothetical protein